MASLADWENIIATRVNSAPLPAMMDAVREAIIELCQRTRIVNRTLQGLDYDSASGQIEIPDPRDLPGMTPSRIMAVWAGGQTLRQSGMNQLVRQFGERWFAATTYHDHGVEQFFSPDPYHVILVPRPTMSRRGFVDIRVSYQPKRNAHDVPDLLYEQFALEIGVGACLRLHSHSQAPYAEAGRVPGLQAEWDDLLNEIGNLRDIGFAQPRLRSATDEEYAG